MIGDSGYEAALFSSLAKLVDYRLCLPLAKSRERKCKEIEKQPGNACQPFLRTIHTGMREANLSSSVG
jgi:hypothetical protein